MAVGCAHPRIDDARLRAQCEFLEPLGPSDRGKPPGLSPGSFGVWRIGNSCRRVPLHAAKHRSADPCRARRPPAPERALGRRVVRWDHRIASRCRASRTHRQPRPVQYAGAHSGRDQRDLRARSGKHRSRDQGLRHRRVVPQDPGLSPRSRARRRAAAGVVHCRDGQDPPGHRRRAARMFRSYRYKAVARGYQATGAAAEWRQEPDRLGAAKNPRPELAGRQGRAVRRIRPRHQPPATGTLRAGGARFLAHGRGNTAVKLGVLQFFSWPERRVDLATVYARALERIEIMDRTGYDAVWLAEHHFSGFSVCPSVHMMGTLAAARTQRLRIGTAVSLAPFYHPLRLAEEIALLDVLSGGRVNWGAGRGFARVEFTAFGVPPEESASRFRETVEIVLRAWTDERLSFAGQHFRYEDVEVLPKPPQRPHPPIWMAASSESAIEWAASRGFSILMDPHSSAPEIGHKRRFYAEKLTASGFSEAGRDIPVARLVAVADSAGKAAAVARSGAEWILNSYLGPQHRPVIQQSFTPAGADPVRRYLDEVILHGTPEKVGDEILRLREQIGLDYLMCAPLSHQSFTLLTEKVLPRIA